MPLLREPNTEPIAGYRLVEFLGSGGFGEVWKCEVPGGFFKAIKFVHGNLQSLDSEGLQVEQEWKALQFVKTIRHPFLLGIDRLEVVDGELLIVMELADRNLADAFEKARQAGRPGIPRIELLAYLREAAEALDVINLQHHLQHLDVKPANLFLVNRHVKVGDFGLLTRVCEEREATSDGTLGGVTPLYGAPETLAGKVSRRSDQYSLAVVYQHLVSGQPPFSGRNARELMVRRATAEPDLSSLPPADRPVVARALAREPAARYPTCTEFVRALAPELMPANFSPFLEIVLTDGTTVPPEPTYSTVARPRDRMLPATPVSDRSLEPAQTDVPDFAGHQLLTCLGRTSLGETWKVQTPDGRSRLLKFAHGLTDGSDSAEVALLDFLTAPLHRQLVPVEVLCQGSSRIALITDPYEGTLADRLQHCQTIGLPGIPRQELLDSLHPIAVALDALYRERRLQHLCLNPRALVLDGKRVLLADMGLGQLLWLPSGQPVGQVNGRYSAPELLAGEISPNCDQYSLAVIFQELLIGTSPFRGPARGKSRPNLDLLPAADRDPIARALHPDPERRFATCTQLLDALDHDAAASATHRPAILLPPVIPMNGGWWTICGEGSISSPPADLPPSAIHPLIEQMLDQVAGGFRTNRVEAFNYLLEPGQLLKHTCAAYLSAQLVALKLDGFRQRWRAELTGRNADAFVLQVPLAGSLWQRWRGRQPALDILVRLTSTRRTLECLTKVHVEIRAVRCQPEQAVVALEQHGIAILRDLRAALQVEPERRVQERLPFEHPVGVFPILGDQQLGDPLVCRGKDLSWTGLGLIASEALPEGHVYVQSLLTPQLAQVGLLGRVVRVQPRGDANFVVGLAFAERPESFVHTRIGMKTVTLDR